MIGNAFVQIFDGAFSPEGVGGGAIGVLIAGFSDVQHFQMKQVLVLQPLRIQQ